jgi:hypothetical protein
VATSGAYTDLTGTPDLSVYATSAALSPVATSGAYTDLTGTPDVSIYATKQDLAPVATTGSYHDLANRPVLHPVATGGDYLVLKNLPNLDNYATKSSLSTVATTGSYADLVNPPDLSVYAKTNGGNQNFDAGTLFIDAATNRVGIGTVSPTKTLQVSGSMQAQDATFTGDLSVTGALKLAGTPKTYYREIVPAAFVQSASDLFDAPKDATASRYDVMLGYGIFVPRPGCQFGAKTCTAELFAPVQLPEGAKIESLACGYYDNNGDQRVIYASAPATGTLYARGTAPTSTQIAAVSWFTDSINKDEVQQTAASTSINTANGYNVVASGRQYFLHVKIKVFQTAYAPVDNEKLRFYGCRVGFTMPQLGF